MLKLFHLIKKNSKPLHNCSGPIDPDPVLIPDSFFPGGVQDPNPDPKPDPDLHQTEMDPKGIVSTK